MGALCSSLSVKDVNCGKTTVHHSRCNNDFPTGKLNQTAQNIYKTILLQEPTNNDIKKDDFSSSVEFGSSKSGHGGPHLSSSSQDSNPTVPKPSNSPVKGSTKISFFEKTSTTGTGKAVEVLDTIGTNATSLNTSNGFSSWVSAKNNKISILAFEVANTIVKGNILMQSLSMKNTKQLKEVVLVSKGVQRLVSTDMNELLRLVAADRRKELRLICREIVRFGNHCKDPQWHNLDHYFARMESDFTAQERLRKTVHLKMENLMSLVRSTAELYHELRLLDKDEQDYKRKEGYSVHKGENHQILKQELNNQRKHVKSLKKKSLWSKNFDEVITKLVDIVYFLHLEIHNVFRVADISQEVEGNNSQQFLGSAGLALHYANIITQINNLVQRASSIPQNLRDALYQGLPLSIKTDLQFKIRSFQKTEDLAVPKIKAEMEKTLHWLVPVANRTSRAHHGFGWVGEWANAGNERNGQLSGQTDLMKIETLHHADKRKTEIYILDLVLLLHHLVIKYKSGCGLRSPGNSQFASPPDYGVSAVSLRPPNGRLALSVRYPAKSPVTSPPNGTLSVSLKAKDANNASRLTREEKEIVGQAELRKLPGESKSQDFGSCKSELSKHDTLSRSNSTSSLMNSAGFPMDQMKVLDAIDRVDSLRT